MAIYIYITPLQASGLVCAVPNTLASPCDSLALVTACIQVNACMIFSNHMHSCAAAGCGGLGGLLVVQSAGSTHKPVGGRPKVDAYPDCDWLHVWEADLW